MGPLDLLTRPLRALLGEAEHEAAAHSPLAHTHEIEEHLGEAIKAMHRAAESVERHVQVIESLGDTLPPLTQSVTQLTDQIGHLLRVTAPLAAAERDVSKVEGMFHRRRHAPEPATEPPDVKPPPAPPSGP